MLPDLRKRFDAALDALDRMRYFIPRWAVKRCETIAKAFSTSKRGRPGSVGRAARRGVLLSFRTRVHVRTVVGIVGRRVRVTSEILGACTWVFVR